MEVIYHQTVIDRTGVDEANNEDRMTARSIIAEMEQVGQERIGYDADGRWHDPETDDTKAPGAFRGVFYAFYFEAVLCALVFLVVHFAQKAGLPW